MAWKAKLLRAVEQRGKWDVVIRYTDGVDKIDQGYSLGRVSKADVQRIARDEVARLEAAKTDSVPIAKGADIDLTPPASPPPPTAAELAKQKWFRDWGKYQTAEPLVKAGVLQASDTRLVNLKNRIVANWLDSYFADL